MSSTSRLLLVEDEARVADDLQQQLSGLGCKVIGLAITTDEVLDLPPRKHGPYLVLRDIHIRGLKAGVATAHG